MGKFYAYIQLDNKKYKICKDDIEQIHSKTKTIKPLIPKYITIKKCMSATTTCSD